MFQGLTGEDLTAFLDTDEFAVTAVWLTFTIIGILDREFYAAEGPESGVALRQPRFTMREADIPAAGAKNDTITISGKAFKVSGIERDGTGLATLTLRNA
jgi:hypothetical protein